MSITDQSIVQKALTRLSSHGAAATLHYACLKLVKLLVPFKILRGMSLSRATPAFLACPQPYTAGFLDAKTLAQFATDPATELSPQFVRDALAAGDKCYGIRHGARLIAYGWYSTRPTPTVSPEVVLHFARGYVYMYKGFTAAPYRGQRLHAIAKARAVRHYLAIGYRGVVSYIESSNFKSLKSNARLGSRRFGSIYLVRVFGRYFAFASPGCKRFDFRLEVDAPAVHGLHRHQAEYSAPLSRLIRFVIGRADRPSPDAAALPRDGGAACECRGGFQR